MTRILERPVLFIIILVIGLGLIGITMRSCSDAQRAAGDARQAVNEGKATTASVKDAAAAVAASDAVSDGIDHQVKDTQNAINKASNVNDITAIGADGVRKHRDRPREP